VLPEELVKPVRAASVADQEKQMYVSQQTAQEARKDFEHAQKEAEMQDKLVESARSVEISKNQAQAAIEKATGEKETKILEAEGLSQYTTKLADANAHKTEVEGQAEATVILRKGQSQAEAYRLSQLALGDDYAKLQMIEAIAKNNMSIIPQNIIIGGEKGGNLIENFLGLSMIEKLTGKTFAGEQSTHTAPKESFIEPKPAEDADVVAETPAKETDENGGETKIDSHTKPESPTRVPDVGRDNKNHRNKK
jgi:uncharacterized membrane protein YqiK